MKTDNPGKSAAKFIKASRIMKLKICGMKYQENIIAVAALQPDYLGFIFHEESPRNFEGTIPEITR